MFMATEKTPRRTRKKAVAPVVDEVKATAAVIEETAPVIETVSEVKSKTTKKTRKKTVAESTPVVEEVKAETTVVEDVPAVSVEETAPVVDDVPETKVKTAEKKKPTKLAKPADKFVIQSGDKDYSMDDIKAMCKDAYRNGSRKHVKSIDVYLKAENGNLRVYYVINGNPEGAFIDL